MKKLTLWLLCLILLLALCACGKQPAKQNPTPAEPSAPIATETPKTPETPAPTEAPPATQPEQGEEYITLTFDSQGGGAVSRMQVKKGESFGPLPTPEKEGFTFRAWVDKWGIPWYPDSKCDSDLTLFAAWDDAAEPLRFTDQPSTKTRQKGEDASYSVEVEGGTAPYTYRWLCDDGYFANNAEVSGADTFRLTLKNVQSEISGIVCTVTDAEGKEITSEKAKLILEEKELHFTDQPTVKTVEQGKSASYSVAVKGGKEPYSFRWFCDDGYFTNNAEVSGADTYRLTLKNTQSEILGIVCVVTDADGESITSDRAALHIRAEFRIGQQPEDYTADLNEYNGALFEITPMDGVLPYTYQWQWMRQGGAIDLKNGQFGEKDSGFTVIGADSYMLILQDIGDYTPGYDFRCKVTDAAGTVVYTEEASLEIIYKGALRIEKQPQEQTVVLSKDNSASFAVTPAGGTVPFSYQWQYALRGTYDDLQDGPFGRFSQELTFSGVNTATLALQDITGDAYGYVFRCKITDAKGSVVYTEDASLYLS